MFMCYVLCVMRYVVRDVSVVTRLGNKLAGGVFMRHAMANPCDHRSARRWASTALEILKW